VAIAVLPAPEVPTTTTRICLSLVPANEDIQLRAKDSNVCCWPTRRKDQRKPSAPHWVSGPDGGRRVKLSLCHQNPYPKILLTRFEEVV